MISPDALGEVVNEASVAYRLRPDIVMCIIIQESAGDTFATRFERLLYETNLSTKTRNELSGWVPAEGSLPSLNTELVDRSKSWGLMQVLGDTARWCAKYAGRYFTALCDPSVGVDIGCKVLAYYLERSQGDYRTALCRYNAGSPSSPDGQLYAQEVLARVARGEYKTFLRS